MNIALITSNHLRHKFISHKLSEQLNLKLILTENKRVSIEDTSKYSSDKERETINLHFESRRNSEEEFFSEYMNFPENVLHVPVEKGNMNSQVTLDLLQKMSIDIIVLYGCALIKDIILDEFEGKVINLHLGLSPYYRGSGTNFFPIVNNEFECLGATFHLATKIIDGGAILSQIRPDDLNEKDTVHSIGNKVIKKAAEVYPSIIKNYYDGLIIPQKQLSLLDYKEYKSSDFNYNYLNTATDNLRNGKLKNYLQNKLKRDFLKKTVK